MLTFIPIQYYITIYNIILLIFAIAVFANSNQLVLEDSHNLDRKKSLGVFVCFFIIIYIGLRPVNFRFGDMVIYDILFKSYINGEVPTYKKDILFDFVMYNFSKFKSSILFFFFCCLVYVLPLYFACKKIFKDYWFYAFFMLVISFSFWSYGTNGIRNGMATSLFILGLSKKNFAPKIMILLLAVLLHKSLILPFLAYLITLYYNKPRILLFLWFTAIPVSFILGGFFTNLFLNLGLVEEDRLTGYFSEFNQAAEGVVFKVGFRWDFLLYSASGVYAGWYFIFKRNFVDVFYSQLFNIYLIVNAFWVLVIRANFSNRFAYLSWFLLGILIIYPLLKSRFFSNQHQVIGRIIMIYFIFTFFMNVVLS